MNYEFALLCSSPSWGGLEMNFFKWAIWTHQLKFSFLVYVDQSTTIFNKLQNFPQIQTQSFKRNLKKFDLFTAYKLAKSFKKSRISKVLVTSNIDLDLVCWVKFFNPKLKIIYVQQMQLGVIKKNFYFNWKYKEINTWVTPLPWLKQQLKMMTNLSDEQIKLHPLPIDCNNWTSCSKEEKMAAKKKLNLPENSTVIGLLGRIDPGKKQKLVLEAFINLLERRSDLKSQNLHLLFAGEPTLNEQISAQYFQELKNKVQTSQLTKQVTFIAHQDNPSILYQALDYFIMPTSKESFGMVTLEALASGLTVIGCNDGGTKELLEDGKWGYLFEADNYLSLSLALEKGLESKDQNLDRQNYLNEFDYRKVLPNIYRYFS